MKIVHMTSAHPAFDVRIFLKQCRSLAKMGHEVVLIAPHRRAEVVEGVRIRPVAARGNKWLRLLLTVPAVLKVALSEKAQIYHFHDPELAPVGLVLRLFRRTVVYDVHEDLPGQIQSKAWIPRVLRPGLGRAARVADTVTGQVVSGVVAVSELVGKRFPPGKTVIVRNYPVEENSVDVQPTAYHERPALFIYAGGLTRARGAVEMVEGLGRISTKHAAHMAIVGSFQERGLEDDLRSREAWQAVEFLGWKTRDEMNRLFGQARAGLVLYHRAPNHMEARANKLFEYMAAGLPVIASNHPRWQEVVERRRCGLTVDPESPDDIASAMEWILDNPEEAAIMGDRGRAAVREHYNWEMEAVQLSKLYAKLDHGGTASGQQAVGG